jgi:hypothetical protein
VKADTYKIGTDFQRFVIDPAVLEGNGLSDMGVKIEVQRKHGRAPIHSITMSWWKKSPGSSGTKSKQDRPFGEAERSR